MNRFLYLCYGDKPTGVIRSQAMDVVRLLKSLGHEANLAVAVPLRSATETSSSFRQLAPDGIFFTAVPTRLQRAMAPVEAIRIARLLSSFKASAVICRSAFATDLALRARSLLRRKFAVCLDGRGAMAAEQAEYVVHPAYDVQAVERIERRSVLGADARIAVTEELVAHWRLRYGYHGEQHVVIPTTLSEDWCSTPPSPAMRHARREELGVREEEVLLVYAGSNAPWQGMDLLLDQAERGLLESSKILFLFLTDACERMSRLERASGGRFRRMRVPPDQVRGWMQAADYGLLLRPRTTTNEVAFPTKHAEYLAAGLPVISNGPPAVRSHIQRSGCGLVVDDRIPWSQLAPLHQDRRQECFDVAVRDFSKSSFRGEYARLITWLAERAP